jgi:hypothetical protein
MGGGVTYHPRPPQRTSPPTSAVEVRDALLRFIDVMRAGRPLYESPERARASALDSVETFVRALVDGEDE